MKWIVLIVTCIYIWVFWEAAHAEVGHQECGQGFRAGPAQGLNLDAER